MRGYRFKESHDRRDEWRFTLLFILTVLLALILGIVIGYIAHGQRDAGGHGHVNVEERRG